ncbi:glycoside hydrolase family 3 N-terminal domain-containing protein [Hyalangium sp.]|uniref:glycoside hydrolase family 3 N-terminal domain-containing protein n=1 Tax=Hyalangium sp. TaxID=2028555 RepID=UPI002D4FB916|nr:glycoside hydrolase family 3 N-terminal domain-containing protein [Hyalangium sp.]HYI02485.1 glycoside hydrolase family 3 N-terminal domain-containing protein [Hyalangium sp.]
MSPVPMRGVLRSSLVPLLLLLCTFGDAAAQARKNKGFVERTPDEARVERVLQSLSQRDKVGQLLLAYPQISKDGAVEVGGVLFVGATLRKIDAAKERIRTTRERARIPPFFAVDIEGGSFNRLNRHPSIQALPLARELAAMEDKEVEAWGVRVGKAMREVGLNMNLAPVFDVAAKGHMFRNGRAFSGEPEVVKQKATAFARGLAKAGVAAIGKHFPGYGDLDSDSDHEHATVDWDEARVRAEASVFRSADPFLGGVMMSNIVYSKFGPKPAILEPALVALAHESGWITITDDVAIRALAEQIGAEREEVVRLAFLAGNDLILTTEPPDWSGGMDYFGILMKLAQSDPKLAAQLDAAVRRVLRLKDRLGLLDGL